MDYRHVSYRLSPICGVYLMTYSFDDEELCRNNIKVFHFETEEQARARRRRSSIGSFTIARHEYGISSEPRASLKDRIAVRHITHFPHDS